MYPKQKRDYPASVGQIKTIKMLCRQLNIDREAEHDMEEERYGVRSATKLTYSQAGHFITELVKKGGVILYKEGAVPPAKSQFSGKKGGKQHPRHGAATVPGRSAREDHANVAYMVTADQLDKINAVAELIHWRVENGMALFLEKRMGIKGGKVKTYSQFFTAIEGLKSMYENQMKADYGADWWLLRFEDARIMKYIAEHCPKEYR